jgi:hypothetical protein
VRAGATQAHVQLLDTIRHSAYKLPEVSQQAPHFVTGLAGHLDRILDQLWLGEATVGEKLQQRECLVDQVQGDRVDELKLHFHAHRLTRRRDEIAGHIAYSPAPSAYSWVKKAAPTASTPSSISNAGL